MKKILLLLSILFSVIAYAQVTPPWTKPNNSYGAVLNRGAYDSTLLGPTGCGAPTSLKAVNIKRFGQYFDSCNHKYYLFDPKFGTWDTLHIGVSLATSYIFLNGITESGGTVKLGGNFTENTNSDLGGFKYKLSNGKLFVDAANDSALNVGAAGGSAFRVNTNTGFTHIASAFIAGFAAYSGFSQFTGGDVLFNSGARIVSNHYSLKIIRNRPLLEDSVGVSLSNDIVGTSGIDEINYTPLKIKIRDFSTNVERVLFSVRGNGQLKINTGAQQLGYVLTALDMEGNSEWQAPTGGGPDTSGAFITSIYRKTGSDSVFFVKGGVHTFAFRDSLGIMTMWSLRDSTEWINIKKYFDITDGLEHGIEIKQAIADAKTLKKTLVFPDGNYWSDSTLVMDKVSVMAIGKNVFIRTTNTSGSSSNGNSVFNLFYLKDSSSLQGFRVRGTGRPATWPVSSSTYPIQNGVRVSGNMNTILNMEYKDLQGAGYFAFDEAFDSFKGNIVSGMRASFCGVGYMNYYYQQYSFLSDFYGDSLRMGLVEFGNNNTFDNITLTFSNHAGMVNNGVGDDHDSWNAININHCNELLVKNLQHGLNISNIQMWYTNLKCEDADRLIVTGGAFGQMAVTSSGSSVPKTITVSNVYDGGGVSWTATGTGLILKSGIRKKNTTDMSLEAISASGSNKFSVHSDSSWFYNNAGGFLGSDSLENAANKTNKKVMVRDYVTKRWQQIPLDSIGGTGSSLVVGTSPIGSGTPGRLLFESSTNILQQTANLSYTSASDLFQVGSTSVSTSNVPMVVNTASGHATFLQEWRKNGVIWSGITRNGGFRFSPDNTEITGNDFAEIGYLNNIGGPGFMNMAVDANALFFMGASSNEALRMNSSYGIGWSSSTPNAAGSDIYISRSAAGVMKITTNNATTYGGLITATQSVGAGASPTALLHIGAGTASENTAPVKVNAGTLLTTIEPLTIETNANGYYASSVALNRYSGGGSIVDFTSDVNNSGTGETDLFTYTTKASTLAATGEKIIFDIGGTFNDMTATGQLQFYFGGTNIGNTGALTISATGGWSAKIFIIRTGASTARSLVTVTTPGASTAIYTTETDLTGLTFTNTNIIKVTGTSGGAGGGSGDITAKLGTIFWYGASNN